FLVFRFFILAIAVPIAEEWLLRGFLARYVDGGDRWFDIKLSTISLSAMAVLIAFSVLSHPHEAMAAVVWFSLINWLMKRTGNLWDCVAAHAVTNLLLGVFILSTDQWRLW
ncbi:MAG: CPBP family glutamic-type intramembrane protease, partial [Pirellulaceae bacterium]